MKELTEKQLDYAESLIKENDTLIRRHTPGDLPRYWSVNRAYKTIGYNTDKTLSHTAKESTIDQLLRTIEQAKKKERKIQQKRDEFKAIANGCIALGATAQEVLDYCKQNVCGMIKERAQAYHKGADYCDGFPEQYSDAYKTVARDKQGAQALYDQIVHIERQEAFTLIKPDWWLDIAKVYLKTLNEQKEDPENTTEMD